MDYALRSGHDTLPIAIHKAVTATDAGATGVARLAIEGLLEIVDDAEALTATAALLRDSLPGYAPIWHIVRAAASAKPGAALARIRAELDSAVARSVATAAAWVVERGGPVLAAPSSSVVAQVLSRLGPPGQLAYHGRADDGVDGGTGGAAAYGAAYGESIDAVVGLAGADAIGPTKILNIKGTRTVAERVPTLVVSTSLKLVPESVFATLGAPSFEQIPLGAFAAVVLDGELLSPLEAGRRAALTSGHPGPVRS
jgi:hypothetical protein